MCNTWTSQCNLHDDNNITIMFQSINSIVTKSAEYNKTFNHKNDILL